VEDPSLVKATGFLGGSEGEREVEFLVDTDSYYVVLPRSLARELEYSRPFGLGAL